MALINKSFYDNIDVSVPISFPQQIAWATRSNAVGLKEEMDRWITTINTAGHLQYIFNKYHKFETAQKERALSDYSSLSGGGLSQYDDYLKEHAPKISWDWLLLASLIYQESKFVHEKRSWAGAFGIMQLMPSSASRYGLDSTATAHESILAGIDKLRRLNVHWSKLIPDETERVKFILASYNTGLGHVQDACRLAEQVRKRSFCVGWQCGGVHPT